MLLLTCTALAFLGLAGTGAAAAEGLEPCKSYPSHLPLNDIRDAVASVPRDAPVFVRVGEIVARIPAGYFNDPVGPWQIGCMNTRASFNFSFSRPSGKPVSEPLALLPIALAPAGNAYTVEIVAMQPGNGDEVSSRIRMLPIDLPITGGEREKLFGLSQHAGANGARIYAADEDGTSALFACREDICQGEVYKDGLEFFTRFPRLKGLPYWRENLASAVALLQSWVMAVEVEAAKAK
jgi:hypothetical protein